MNRPPPAPNFAERNLPGVTPALRARLRLLFRILDMLSASLAARVALRLFTTPIRRRPDPAEQQFLDSAQQRALPTSGGTIRCYEWPAEGATVLVVHGWISHAGRLIEVIKVLRAHGLRVVAFDAPAHGRSAGLRADIRAFQAALAAVNAAYGPIDGVLAHSFGALTTASWLAGALPAHLEAHSALPRVRGAVLVGMPRDVQYLMESFASVTSLSPRVVERMRSLMLARYGSYPEQFSAADLAARIHIPVLLVHGGADELVPTAHSTEVAERLANGSAQIVAGQRHGAPLRDPQTVQYMVDFLLEQIARR
ncbi:MAG: alpha/beta fold hydrolase [Steroidobacteraceae bacterium]